MTNIEKLEEKVIELKANGVYAIRTMPVHPMASREQIAGGILALLNGRVVKDTKLF